MIVSRGYLDILLPKKIHPNRLIGSGENERKTEEVGVFWPIFAIIFVPEGQILMRIKKLNSPGNFTSENVCSTFCRAYGDDILDLTNDKADC